MGDNSIRNHNEKGEIHGYQKWYDDGELWLRGYMKNGQEIGYEETNWDGAIGDKHTTVNFYVR
jgi:hypothetical protein